MKIVNLFTICILLSEMLFRVNLTSCSSYKDQKKCTQNKCVWITEDKTCWPKKAQNTNKSVAGLVKTEKIGKGDAIPIAVPIASCSSYKDQKKCTQNKCEWITKDKTCWAKKAEVTDKSVAGVVKTEKIRKGDAIQIAKRS